MILQSLVQYYEALLEKKQAPAPGWCQSKVSFALNISADGELLSVSALKKPSLEKKEMMQPLILEVPQMASKSLGVTSNFLCDSSNYILGIDTKGKPNRTRQCFLAAKKRHVDILDQTSCEAARAVLNYFVRWSPEIAYENQVLAPYLAEIMANANIVFKFNENYVHEDEAVRDAWNEHYMNQDNSVQGICLVTGARTQIARVHDTIYGLQGSRKTGAKLVSFNGPAFESHGHKQGFNAPVGEYAAFAYTTALSRLLKDDKSSFTFYDTTIVYWSKSGDELYQNIYTAIMNRPSQNKEIMEVVNRDLELKKSCSEEIAGLSYEQPFYILGLSPNAARISVNFFFQDTYGNILKNIINHYQRMQIIHSPKIKADIFDVGNMLHETINIKAGETKPFANLVGPVYQSIVSGDQYPVTLFHAVMGRIRGEQDDKETYTFKVSYGRAAIIKTFLLKNSSIEKENITIALNNGSRNIGYLLGREFAVLEIIEKISRGSFSSMKNLYFNAAHTTPARIYPLLYGVSQNHLTNLYDKVKVKFETLLVNIQNSRQNQDLPQQLNFEEQGLFVLGYYHQIQTKLEKMEGTING